MIPQPNIPAIHLYGPLAIHMFGVLVALAILVGARWTRIRGQQLGLSDEKVASMITASVACGFVVAHFFDVFAYQIYEKHTITDILNPFGGLSSYGGFIGALIGLFGWCWYVKEPVMPYADSLGYGLS